MLRRSVFDSLILLGVLVACLCSPMHSFSQDNLNQETQSHFSGSTVVTTISHQDIFDNGVHLFLDHDFKRAANQFKHCIQLEPNNADYHCWLAQTLAFGMKVQVMKGASKFSLLSQGRKMSSLYERALELSPTNERARVGRAIILRDIPGWLGGSLTKAEAMFKGVIEDNPNSVAGLHYLGTLYIKDRKKYQKGIDCLTQAIEISHKVELTDEEKFKMASTYHAVGKVYLEKFDKPKEALPYLEKSLEINPDSMVTLIDLTDAYRLVGQSDKAKDMLTTAVSIYQENKYSYFKKKLSKAARSLKMSRKVDLKIR